MFHIALRKNGRTVKKMGDYDSQAAAASDARAFVDSGVVPQGVSVLVCDGSSVKARTAPKRKNPHATMAAVRAANKAAGGKWFDRGANKFFGTRIVGGPYGGHYFVSAETDPSGKTAYTVRRADDDGRIHTVGDFHSYAKKADAVSVAKSLGKEAAKVRKTVGARANPGARKNPRARFVVYDAGEEYTGGDRYDILDTRAPGGVGPRVYSGQSLNTGEHFEVPRATLPGKRIPMAKLPPVLKARAAKFVAAQTAVRKNPTTAKWLKGHIAREK